MWIWSLSSILHNMWELWRCLKWNCFWELTLTYFLCPLSWSVVFLCISNSLERSALWSNCVLLSQEHRSLEITVRPLSLTRAALEHITGFAHLHYYRQSTLPAVITYPLNSSYATIHALEIRFLPLSSSFLPSLILLPSPSSFAAGSQCVIQASREFTKIFFPNS